MTPMVPDADDNPSGQGFSSAEAEACRQLIELGLAEEFNAGRDITTSALVEASAEGAAGFVARVAGVLAGLPAADAVCRAVDPRIEFRPAAKDGDCLRGGAVIARVSGPVRGLLACERLALNFLCHLSGVATLTRRFVEAVGGSPCRIYDTRKTLPGWRLLEKYAVRQGGGHNHRLGLYDAVLIKDNHLAYWAGSTQMNRTVTIADAIRHARATATSARFVEVEVDTLAQLRDALAGQPDAVLLDNMDCESLRQAVLMRNQLAPGVILEASGGITLETVAARACAGVDRVSVGALTQSAPALDIGLDWNGP